MAIRLLEKCDAVLRIVDPLPVLTKCYASVAAWA